MINGNSKRAAGAALAFVFVAAAIPPANAQQTDLRTYLVGTWRQSMSGVVTQLRLSADGTYIKYMFINGNTKDPAWMAGTWVANRNVLRLHISGWYPTWERGCPPGDSIDPSCYQRLRKVEIHQREEQIPFEVIDQNHTRNQGGIATRILR